MTDLTQIFRDTISPDKFTRNNAEQHIQELIKNPDFISNLPDTYMISNDISVAQVSSTIYKNNIHKITNKELLIETSLNALNKILSEKSIEGTKTHIYRLHCEVLKRTIITKELFNFSINILNILTIIKPENYINNIIALEILNIETQRNVYKKKKNGEKNIFEEFYSFYINLLQSPFNKQNKVYYNLIFQIFQYVFEHYKILTTDEISICLNEAILFCEDINLKSIERKYAQDIISISFNKLFDSHYDKNKIWEKALIPINNDFSKIDNIFNISYQTLINFIKENGIETLDSYGKTFSDDLNDILFSCALIFQYIFEKKKLCIKYASKFPLIFEEIYMPFMSLNLSKIDLFLSDPKEFYSATCSPYIQGLSDLFETSTVDFIDCCIQISPNDLTFAANIYEYILQKCLDYDKAKNIIDPQILICLNDSNIAHDIINNSQGENAKFIQLMNQKYACLRILAMLSYSIPTSSNNFPGDKFSLQAITTVLSDLESPIEVLKSTACFFLEQFYPEDINRYSSEFINITDKILNIIINKLMIIKEKEGLRLVATKAILFYIDDRSNSDNIEYQIRIKHQREIIIENMPLILNNFISIRDTRNKEILDYLMDYFPKEIKDFVPPLIIALIQKIDELDGSDKELITEYLISVGELILMISLLKNLGNINMITESSKIEEIFNSIAPIMQKNLKDTHYLPEFIDVLSNFTFSMCNPLPILPYMDQIMQFPESEMINVMDELERVMDNIISFINPYVFYGVDNLIKFIDFSQMNKYAVSYKCININEFSSNLYIQVSEERKGRLIVKQDIKNDLSPLIMGAIDFLTTIFNNISLIDMMNQESIMIEKTKPEKTEKILSYVNRFKEIVFQNPTCIVEEEIVLISKIYEALALNLISKSDSNYIMQISSEVFSCMFTALEKIDDDGIEAVMICNVFLIFFIRNPLLIQQIGIENWHRIIKIMYKTKSVSSRLHERSLILLFFSKIISLPIEQIFLSPLNNINEEIKMLADIFSLYLIEHFEYLIERYFITEDEQEWFNELCEDPDYQSILDHIDVTTLLRDIIQTCQQGSLFIQLINFIPDENREKVMKLLS